MNRGSGCRRVGVRVHVGQPRTPRLPRVVGRQQDALAIEAYGLERILLATDYPWHPRGPRLADVHANADAAAVAAIFHANVPLGLRLPGRP